MKTRALLVGTGGWAETHLRAYQECEQIAVVALVGHRNRERLAALAEKYGVPVASLDLAEALRQVEPDMVDLACNPHFRLEGVRAAMQPSNGFFQSTTRTLATGPNSSCPITFWTRARLTCFR